MSKIVAQTNWWSVDLCPYCNYEYKEHQIHQQVNCPSCGAIDTILAPFYHAAKRKLWTAKYPRWKFWKKDEFHYEYHGLRELTTHKPDKE